MRLTLLAAISAGAWILFVAGVKPQEMLVGPPCILASTLFVDSVERSQTRSFRLTWRDIAAGWRIPAYLCADLGIVLAVLCKDLLHLQPAGSYYRVCGFKTSKDDPLLLGRRVLATIYTSATPNSIVLGTDYTQSRMLFHQLARTELTRMARSLGAQS